MKCFKQCLKLNASDPQLWVEHGSFAYNVYSFCSRTLKFWKYSLSNDEIDFVITQKGLYENIAGKSFDKVNIESENGDAKNNSKPEETGNHEDEKWLYHYMLGKISEKRKEPPISYLSHYLKSAKYLYECNATYPIKVNHSNPSHLSIETLELFYRTNAAIIKYTEQHTVICKQTAELFRKILKELSVSPFAVNRAKIKDIAFQQKLNVSEEQHEHKIIVGASDILTEEENEEAAKLQHGMDNMTEAVNRHSVSKDHNNVNIDTISTNKFEDNKSDYQRRRASHESGAATNTTTTTTSNATSSVSSDSESPNSSIESSTSDSDSTTDDEATISIDERDAIFEDCIKNLEECITRFPEHYKSIYRLAYHYMHAPGATNSLDRCRELMLGSYKTTLGNEIAGLFTEKRNNNFFNGIWRIPSSDIDRPGSFASHLSKSVIILLLTLKQINDHETLLDLAIQLYRTPDADK
ncbi:calcineurin-binding protein cabin-1-like [Topomyia yanbarensis]|uniref:calcineurin-binding protein cabin-1-like n=1 Tax=Topomyia yanbarensis TaxID=2498891 RepID=UPI00273CE02D|nr:calcineurin-binding protein cabin-1-like [Topomyia yanbarensis]